ncbi:MAG: methyltransferase domain-containing protein [Chloroflexi bacterium]|nr:methyltransferase domain-containing protein [Chloroflexota bacterium]
MTLSLDDLAFLTAPAGARLLHDLAGENLDESNTLRLLTTLRKTHPAAHARAALEIARLRRDAVDKFGDDARRLLFTRAALEQASDPLVRRYRAGQVAARSLVDAGCGIGADALAFAAAGTSVHGLDIDPLRVAMARHNAAALGLDAHFETADVRQGLPDAEVVFFDPARRDEQGRRIHDVEHYQPPLSTLRGWKHRRIIVKLSPGLNLAQVAAYGGAVEFISVEGDLKEAVLWLGAGLTGTRATLLANGQVYHWQQPPLHAEVPLCPPRAWLVEPDPALIRAGLVQDAAALFGGALLDTSIAYFTTETRPDSPWTRAWRVLDWMPFNLKKLRAYLQARQIGRITVKKRGSAVTPEELLSKLKLKGTGSCTLVLTRCRGQPVVLICEDYSVEI